MFFICVLLDYRVTAVTSIARQSYIAMVLMIPIRMIRLNGRMIRLDGLQRAVLSDNLQEPAKIN
jgi:hypothetical protein